jgi:hypothetical protein
MRELLEMIYSCVVTIHWIGTPTDFLKVLEQGETAPRYLLICGHGDEAGFYLGEYGLGIDTSMLIERCMPPEAIAPIVNLPGCTVISTTCGGGYERMGKAFVQNGKISAYIGCDGANDSTDMLIFLVHFFYNVLRKKLSDLEAWYQAMLVAERPAFSQISFYHADGKVEHYDPAL